MTKSIVIRGGKVFDPSCGWNGVERDLFIANGRLVDRLDNVEQVIDAKSLAVTPGAIDLCSSVAGYGQNFLRLWERLASPRELAQSYARLGYTHIHEPFLTVSTANYVHQELAAIPILDTSASLTLNLRDFDTWLSDAVNFPEISTAWSYLLEHCRALNLRVVEPYVKYRQDFYFHRTRSLETVIELLSRLLESSDNRITLKATPDLLTATLPVHPRLHLEALGPALLDDELYDKAGQHLENGLSADIHRRPCRQYPSRQRKVPPASAFWISRKKIETAVVHPDVHQIDAERGLPKCFEKIPDDDNLTQLH